VGDRVLLIEDDSRLAEMVSEYLGKAGFHVVHAETGTRGLALHGREPADVVIPDLMLPDADGLDICRQIRARSDSPILMLTAKGLELSRVDTSARWGVIAVLAKPFSPRELVLRVKSIFRRTKDERSDMLRIGNIQLYPDRHQCFVGNEQVTLTAKEFDLLYELMRARGNVLTRDVLMDKVWGYHGEATSRTLDTHVRRVREKLGNEGLHVETVRGVGYRMGSPAEHG